MNVIETVGLRKTFGEVRAVDGIDLQVRSGEVTAVLGPNGAGKTTTIEMLLGLRAPTAGQVRVLGTDPHSTAVRARVGAMLQDTDAPESLTVTETVDLVATYYPSRLPTDEVLRRADLVPQARHRVAQLSGGQRQRLSFALAVVGDPDLLFLDEPTAALDVVARRAFWAQVAGFADLGKTILFSTHNLAEADEFAGRVIVIHAGRVIQDGTPAEAKRLVAGRTVQLLTDAPEALITALPGVRALIPVAAMPQDAGAAPGLHRVRMQVTEAEPALRELFARDHRVQDLTVHEATLEDAFVHLTGNDRPRQPSQTTMEVAS